MGSRSFSVNSGSNSHDTIAYAKCEFESKRSRVVTDFWNDFSEHDPFRVITNAKNYLPKDQARQDAHWYSNRYSKLPSKTRFECMPATVSGIEKFMQGEYIS
jgi:hypothetical protein